MVNDPSQSTAQAILEGIRLLQEREGANNGGWTIDNSELLSELKSRGDSRKTSEKLARKLQNERP